MIRLGSQRWCGKDAIPLWLSAFLFALAYYATAWLGKGLSVTSTVNVNIWLPAGVYLAAVLLNSQSHWPWLAVAALVANFAFDYQQGTRPATMIFWFWAANTVQSMLGAWLLQRVFKRRITLGTLAEFGGVVGIAGLGTTMLGALIGAAALVHYGASDSFQESWLVWWGSCAMPVLVLTPFLIVWCSQAGRQRVIGIPARKIPEALVLFLVLVFTVNYVMRQGGVLAPYKIWLVPVLLYAGTRFGLHGATAATVLCSLMVAFYNAKYGPPGTLPTEQEAFVLQSTLAAISLVGIVPAIVLGERTRALAALRDSEERFAKAFHSSSDAILITDLETGQCIDANESFYRLFALTRDEVVGKSSLELGLWRDAEERVEAARKICAEGTIRGIESTRRDQKGGVHTVVVNADMFDLAGRRTVVTTLHDITAQRKAESTLREAQAEELRAREEFARKLIEAQENERHRLAAELHDSLGQNLSVIKSRTLLASEIAEIPAAVAGHLEAIDRVVGAAIAEARSLAHNLRPPHIDDVGLTESLRALVAEVSQASKIHLEPRLENVDDLFKGPEATHFFRIVQEALNNLVKHSRATNATVALERDVRWVSLEIVDNGVGFDPAVSGGKSGLGLTSMRERAHILGGTISVQSEPANGTCLTLAVPIAEEGPEYSGPDLALNI